MKKFTLTVSMIGWEKIQVIKFFEIKANSFQMAAAMCKAQAAINGWKVLEIVKYEV